MRAAALAFFAFVGLVVLLAPRSIAQAETSARAPHPEPRVIVNVVSVRGPHLRAELERSARAAWGRIVRCYKAQGRAAKGRIALEVVVDASGRVLETRRVGSTLENDELVACLIQAMKAVAMPSATARSTALTEIHVAPGDPPSR